MKPHQELSEALSALVLADLLDCGRYHLPGFGVFTLRIRAARRIRNPITREFMWLPETPEVRFHAAKRLRGRMNHRLARRKP